MSIKVNSLDGLNKYLFLGSEQDAPLNDDCELLFTKNFETAFKLSRKTYESFKDRYHEKNSMTLDMINRIDSFFDRYNHQLIPFIIETPKSKGITLTSGYNLGCVSKIKLDINNKPVCGDKDNPELSDEDKVMGIKELDIIKSRNYSCIVKD